MLVGTVLKVETGGRPAVFRQVMRELELRPSARMPWLRFRRNGGKLEVFRVVAPPTEGNGWSSELRLVAVLNPSSRLALRITRAGAHLN